MKSTGKILLLAASTLLLNNTAQAEAPMNVDDAGTLAVGGMKVEGVWRKDDQTRGPEMAFGFSPLNNVEVQSWPRVHPNLIRHQRLTKPRQQRQPRDKIARLGHRPQVGTGAE